MANHDPWGGKTQQPPDLSEVFGKIIDAFNSRKSSRNNDNGDRPPMNQSNSFKSIVVTIIVLVSIFLVSSTYYTINSGTVGVLVTFGKFSNDIKLPGLHFKMPVMMNVEIVDIKMQTANYFGDRDLPDNQGVTNSPRLRVLDNKSLPIGIEMSVQYTPKADESHILLAKYGRNYFNKLINPLVRDSVRNVIGRYNAESIAQERAKIGTEIQLSLGDRFKGLPFILTNIALRNIQLPEIVLKKVKEVQLAKQEEQRLAMVEKQATKEQHIKTIQANTKLIEVTTHAKAEAEKQRIEADANAYQIEKEAVASANANKLIAASVTPELINYRSVDQWDGKYPRMMLSGSQGGMILSLPSVGSPEDKK